MHKKLFTLALSAILVVAMAVPTLAATDLSTSDESLLYTQSAPNSHAKGSAMHASQTRLERHKLLLRQGYILVNIAEEENIDRINPSRAYNDYETRAVTSYYTQPIKATTKKGSILDGISNVNSYILTPLSFVPSIGWIPSALGIASNLLTDFISRGEVEFKMASTLRYYDIDVRQKGTTKYYFVASSQKSEEAVTITAIGYKANGTPFGNAKTRNFASQSPNYANYASLSEIAKEYYVTGGPHFLYTYFEQYSPIDTYYF